VRFIVELRQTDDNVEGEVTPEGATQAQPFSSWLELLRLLEPPSQKQGAKWFNTVNPASTNSDAILRPGQPPAPQSDPRVACPD
jgi:hypothetical protein